MFTFYHCFEVRIQTFSFMSVSLCAPLAPSTSIHLLRLKKNKNLIFRTTKTTMLYKNIIFSRYKGSQSQFNSFDAAPTIFRTQITRDDPQDTSHRIIILIQYSTDSDCSHQQQIFKSLLVSDRVNRWQYPLEKPNSYLDLSLVNYISERVLRNSQVVLNL